MIYMPEQFRTKTKRAADRPYLTLVVHDNGAVTIDKSSSTHQFSIRRIYPCLPQRFMGGV